MRPQRSHLSVLPSIPLFQSRPSHFNLKHSSHWPRLLPPHFTTHDSPLTSCGTKLSRWPALSGLPLAPPFSVRRSARIPKQIPILLIGSDLDGRMFSERTTTVLLSLHGAGILSCHKLSPEQELILRWTEKNKETDIRIVGQIGEQAGLHTYGAAFFDQNLNFWELDFPPISDIEKNLGFICLRCSSCGALEKIDDTSVEADVCATNDSVLRSCKRCGATTLWKPASGPATGQSVPAAIRQPPASTPLPPSAAPVAPPPPPTPAPLSNSDPAPPSSPAPPAPQFSFYAPSRGISPDTSSASSNFAASRPDPAWDPARPSPGLVADAVGEPRAALVTMPPPVQH